MNELSDKKESLVKSLRPLMSGGFWAAGLLGALVLSGCGSRPEANVLDRDMGQRNPEMGRSTEVPGQVDSAIVGDVTTSGGGTKVVFPSNAQPSNEDPEPGVDLFPVYGDSYYRTYGQDVDYRINVATGQEEHHDAGEDATHGS